MQPRARTAVAKGPAPRGAGEQLTITGFLDNLARKAEVHDPMRPATRLFVVVLALSLLGFLMQAAFVATTHAPREFVSELRGQAMLRVLSVGVMLLAFRLGPAGLRRFLPHLVVLSAVLLVLVFVEPFRAARNGAFRWVEFPLGARLTFQPSELARIVVVLWVADRCVKLGSRVHDLRRGVMPMLMLALVFFLLVLVETDLGGSMLLLICALSTMWVGGARMLPVGASLVAIGGGAITAAGLFVPYMRNRIAMWFGQVDNGQVSGTLKALSSGDLFGVGYGQGGFRNDGVPYLESDYVFALVGEELGVVGMWIVLALWLAFLWYALRLVLSLRERYEALASFGLLLSVALQAMVHVQVVSGLAPPKGMTLPFLSDGGTSLIVSSFAVGLALGAARKTHEELYPCTPSNATA
ncbi:MAG: FtsW/RodA/SpoVE family cell cycle protein [Planctomycetes bacterium]|nr:FtsW/RodA/SpoVE family cell cycle protein [Planctomycetota bacterium]